MESSSSATVRRFSSTSSIDSDQRTSANLAAAVVSHKRRRLCEDEQQHLDTLASRLPADMVRQLNEMRTQQLLCDGVLCGQYGGRFPVHRVVVATASPLLFEQLRRSSTSSTLSEEVGVQDEIIVPNASADTLKLLVDFVYTNQCDLSGSSAQQLLLLSSGLKLNPLVQYCVRFLVSQINTHNCVEQLDFAERHGFGDLVEACRHYILYNFYSLLDDCCDCYGNAAGDVSEVAAENVDTGQLLRLSAENLITFLDDDFLNVDDERRLFSLIVKWTEHHGKLIPCSSSITNDSIDCSTSSLGQVSRSHQWLSQMLAAVRLGLTSREYITSHVSGHPLVLFDQKARSVVQRALTALNKQQQTIADPAITDVNDLQTSSEVVERVIRPRVPGQLVLVVGGWSVGAPVSSVQVYDARADRWLSLPDSSDPQQQPHSAHIGRRAYHGLEILPDGHVYCVGGFDGDEHYSAASRTLPGANHWTQVTSMHLRRCYISTCVLDGKLVAVGGSDGRQRHAACEIYSPPPLNQWHYLPPLQQSRSDAAAVAANGRLFVLGGFDGRHVLSSVEVYDPASSSWTFADAMSQPRSGLSAVVCAGYVYVMGGFNGHQRLGSCERLLVAGERAGGWQMVPDMHTPRSNFAAAVVDEHIIVMGGFDGRATVASVEKLSTRHGRWTQLRDMAISRSALSCCVLSSLEQRKQLSYVAHLDRRQRSGAPSDDSDRHDSVTS